MRARHSTSLRFAALVTGLSVGAGVSTIRAQSPSPTPVLLHTSDAQRQQYLANAVIWESRQLPTPDQLRAGPAGRNPVARLELNAAGEIPCTYLQGGCPSNPMTGEGPRDSRRYLGVVEAFYRGTMITSGLDTNQGWTFAEVAAAIGTLPPDRRALQQMHFDALSLLAAFVQHGDRKPSQQRLVCATPLDLTAGDVDAVDDDNGLQVAVLDERDNAKACQRSLLTIQDLGATLGEGGQFTLNVLSKAHLSSWAPMKVFAFPGAKPFETPACHAAITVSNTAGPDGLDDPRVGEAGRRLLYTVMAALTPAHVRAIFEAARIDALDERQTWRDPKTGRELTGIDAWVGVFLHKVEELGATTCPA